MAGTPITRYWLIPPDLRPKMFMPHPTMNSEEMRAADAGRMGPLLQFQRGVEAIELHAELAGAPGVHFYLEAVPADVREHRYRHRQRAPESGQPVGSLAGRAVPQAVSRKADAGIAGAAAQKAEAEAAAAGNRGLLNVIQ